jgi:hypothetical protein
MSRRFQMKKTWKTITEAIYSPACSHKLKELNEHGNRHTEIAKEGQEDQV